MAVVLRRIPAVEVMLFAYWNREREIFLLPRQLGTNRRRASVLNSRDLQNSDNGLCSLREPDKQC